MRGVPDLHVILSMLYMTDVIAFIVTKNICVNGSLQIVNRLVEIM